MIVNGAACVMRQSPKLVHRIFPAPGVQAIGRQLLRASRMQPVQFSLFADARLVEVHYRAGKNRLTNVLGE